MKLQKLLSLLTRHLVYVLFHYTLFKSYVMAFLIFWHFKQKFTAHSFINTGNKIGKFWSA